MDLREMVRLRLGCTFAYELPAAVPALLQVAVRHDDGVAIRHETWDVPPAAQLTERSDPYGNTPRLVTLPPGSVHIGYDVLVDVPGRPDEMDATAVQHRIEDLPAEALHFLLASRYCQSDELAPAALELFGGTAPGWPRAQAICDWVHDNIKFQYGTSNPLTTAVDVLEQRKGVCRDLAHLAITFCRALNIPSRYVFGYLPDIYVPPPDAPMDFAAWMEVYLGDRWWTFDPRNNERRVGRVLIGRGRDALDVAMLTTFGSAQFRSMVVWADRDEGEA
jgi:transglutaminase-like putative cysteine protease